MILLTQRERTKNKHTAPCGGSVMQPLTVPSPYINAEDRKQRRFYMNYYIYKAEPNAIMHTIEAESKKEALKKYNNLFCTNYKMTSKDKAIGRERIEIVTVSDYRNYNFSKFSYAI